MQIALLLLFGSYLSYTDLTRHIVGNRTLLIFLSAILVGRLLSRTLTESLAFFFKAALVILLLQWLTGSVLGMGDAKYLAVLALLIGRSDFYFRGLAFVALYACISGLLLFVWRHSLSAPVPLAPAISAGFISALL